MKVPNTKILLRLLRSVLNPMPSRKHNHWPSACGQKTLMMYVVKSLLGHLASFGALLSKTVYLL